MGMKGAIVMEKYAHFFEMDADWNTDVLCAWIIKNPIVITYFDCYILNIDIH